MNDKAVIPAALTFRGGGGPPIVLVHGLMGRGSTWGRQLPWLTRLGAVYTYDAPGHRGRGGRELASVGTEQFVADLTASVEPLGSRVVLLGHSMGGLHSWCLAGDRPDLVRGLVVEDMSPDFVGRTTGPWEPWLHALPEEFPCAEAVLDEFGEVAGRYFLEAFDRTSTGWRLHGLPATWIAIAAEWGTRDYWQQWAAVRAPALLIEAGNSVTPAGQMARMRDVAACPARYVRIPEAGHLVHDDAPQQYREVVEEFLVSLPA